MMQDEIIRMAREAGFGVSSAGSYVEAIGDELNLHNFAALVAAHEREACAKTLEDENLADSNAIAFIRARGEK